VLLRTRNGTGDGHLCCRSEIALWVPDGAYYLSCVILYMGKQSPQSSREVASTGDSLETRGTMIGVLKVCPLDSTEQLGKQCRLHRIVREDAPCTICSIAILPDTRNKAT
jgi:hypothetical protein